MTKVKCSVNTCEFWGKGNVCKADGIWVKNNVTGYKENNLSYHGGVELAEELGQDETNPDKAKKTSAETSRQTCCETMRPRSRQEDDNGQQGRREPC